MVEKRFLNNTYGDDCESDIRFLETIQWLGRFNFSLFNVSRISGAIHTIRAYEESPDGSWKVYLGTMAIISYSSSDGHHIRYHHKDRLGTSLTFSDEDGQVVGRRHYDAFGKPRMLDGSLMEPGARPRLKNFADYAGVNNIGITRRGFTDHLHLDDVEL